MIVFNVVQRSVLEELMICALAAGEESVSISMDMLLSDMDNNRSKSGVLRVNPKDHSLDIVVWFIKAYAAVIPNVSMDKPRVLTVLQLLSNGSVSPSGRGKKI